MALEDLDTVQSFRGADKQWRQAIVEVRQELQQQTERAAAGRP
jgi:hypothetical protein